MKKRQVQREVGEAQRPKGGQRGGQEKLGVCWEGRKRAGEAEGRSADDRGWQREGGGGSGAVQKPDQGKGGSGD